MQRKQKMNRNDVVQYLSERLDLPRKDVESFFRALGELLDRAIEEGFSLRLPHFRGELKFREKSGGERMVRGKVYKVSPSRELRYRRRVKLS